jgi:hypothetical protein
MVFRARPGIQKGLNPAFGGTGFPIKDFGNDEKSRCKFLGKQEIGILTDSELFLKIL